MEVPSPPQPSSKPKPRLDIVASGSPESQQHGKTHSALLDRSSSSLGIRPFFKSLEWSADGTTVIASSSDDRICSYVLPQSLLEPRQAPFSLSPQGVLTLPEPSRAIAPCPYYSLGYPLTQTVLVACKDHPIQLLSAFPDGLPEESLRQEDADDEEEEEEPTNTLPASPSASSVSSASSSSSTSSRAPSQARRPQHQPPLASYSLIKRETEAFLTSSSIIWQAPGTHFVAGSNNLIAYFDASRTGEGPVSRIPTIPSTRHLLKGGGVGMKGTVSALAAQPDTSLVAAGTWTRWVGLYDLSRADSCAIWSPCGRYLVLNERRSTSLAVYDVRVTGRLLSRLVDRDADTNQCLGCDVFASPAGEGADGSIFEIWAGTRDGRVLAWDAVGGHASDGGEERLSSHTWEWQAHGTASAVGSTALHPGGSVLATCAGSWEVVVDESDSEDSDADGVAGRRIRRPALRTSDDTSLRIWSIGSGGDTPGQD
ncbi:hypothetical protein GGTG_03739 [Gaeumannomyces tritici R3-111a-1]|uniref:WD repeat-containing protein n=1 Tax=Gaeumannomyces tritici (strain R3-111a-1) TaxID=644352 RepID=J3NR34_GAET3|nr:hypothetical protein GGTG_03739 [Gaeumannomyces tritici R3-111a-1]EJT78640.1 hypothetical protein GGTG_03739 [Gaeumannomyces tritici R3-111a-1]